jgi:hypothetical protein
MTRINLEFCADLKKLQNAPDKVKLKTNTQDFKRQFLKAKIRSSPVFLVY